MSPVAQNFAKAGLYLVLIAIFAKGCHSCVTGCGNRNSSDTATTTAPPTPARAQSVAPPVADPQREVTLSFPEGTSADTQAVAKQALTALRQACPPLNRNYWGAVRAIGVTAISRPRGKCSIADEICSLRLGRYRWDVAVGITIELGDTGIPETSGESLHFWLGIGKKPGLLMNKSTEKLLCGLDADNGDDVLVPIPALKGILLGEEPPDAAAPLSRGSWGK